MPKSMIFSEQKPEQKPVTDWKQEILKSISYSGTIDSSDNVIIGNQTHLNNITDSSNGKMRISRSAVKNFYLVVSQPNKLSGFDKREIRCTLCHRIISYPAWYYEVKYNVNHFHYFVCFDSDSPSKPTVKCYRRS